MKTNAATRIAPANEATIGEAVDILSRGGLVAFPTETVYGLGTSALDEHAVARLFEAKGRPAFNPLIVHVANVDVARAVGRFDRTTERLIAAFWPGPLTLVTPKAHGSDVSNLATAGLDTVGVRMPHHVVARALLAAFEKPLVAPSANRSGHVSPTTAQHVMSDLDGRVDLILDGGATPVGVELTIVACLDGAPRLLRPGGISREAIEDVLGSPLHDATVDATEKPIAPGMLLSHYAPRALLRLNATSVGHGEALLAFGPGHFPGASPAVSLNLSPRGDLVEAAANLFAYLRQLDQNAAAIAVMPIPEHGLGEAINDRLRRAAAPRI